MALKREDAINRITAGIGLIVTICKLRGAIHLFNTNVVSHEFWCRVLNAIYDLQLHVMDRIIPNFPAIDLGDAINKRAFQITAEKGSDKIQSTLDMYARRGLEKEYGKLQVLVIGDRQGSYKRLSVPSTLSFAWEDDILGIVELIKIIERLETNRLERVASVVSSEVKLRGLDAAEFSPATGPQLACVFDGFQTVQVNFGTLYKMQFKVEGGDPGECCCEITAEDHTSFAKWDETANPLRDDRLDSFAPEMVPATFNNRVFPDRPYSIPILIRANGEISVFNAFWFGHGVGYYNQPPLSLRSDVKVALRGSGLTWTRTFSVQEIVSGTPRRAGDVNITGNLVAGSGERGPGGDVRVEGGTGRQGASGGNVSVGPGTHQAGAGGPGGKGGDIIVKGGDAE